MFHPLHPVSRRFIARLRIAACFALFALVLAAAPGKAAAANFTVTASDMTNYTINGQPDPVLNLVRGRTYTFAANTPGHPFYIKTAQVTGSGSQFTTGVTNNGAESGTLTFTVPSSAPNQLFYQCGVHTAMTNAINISIPLVAGGGAASAALLALLLLGAGTWRVVSMRRRAPGPQLSA